MEQPYASNNYTLALPLDALNKLFLSQPIRPILQHKHCPSTDSLDINRLVAFAVQSCAVVRRYKSHRSSIVE